MQVTQVLRLLLVYRKQYKTLTNLLVMLLTAVAYYITLLAATVRYIGSL